MSTEKYISRPHSSMLLSLRTDEIVEAERPYSNRQYMGFSTSWDNKKNHSLQNHDRRDEQRAKTRASERGNEE
ncbi:hypothetical protein EYF80_026193 [Liparis tanakae]|uniref:Uncharacterized protein n=1 Tax=Liparis tanakae TaxID=230148 RepID=A0A4Z2HD33_9TELE|nr:hypothetical protein EYF80_026193 [Liparis tanakae]